MERKPINSSKIRAVGYEPKSVHGRALADELLRGQDRRELSFDAPEVSRQFFIEYEARQRRAASATTRFVSPL